MAINPYELDAIRKNALERTLKRGILLRLAGHSFSGDARKLIFFDKADPSIMHSNDPVFELYLRLPGYDGLSGAKAFLRNKDFKAAIKLAAPRQELRKVGIQTCLCKLS